MAAPAVEAFGAYLRQLRERRGLSLDDVASLSSTFPDPVAKAYLSRCENGKLKIAFSKTIALSRIYEVPPEVLAERMRLDLEIDRLGGPDTSGMGFRELYKAAIVASHEGRHWDAYAIARDLTVTYLDEPVIEHVTSVGQQLQAVRLRLASLAIGLDALAFTRFELHEIDETKLSPYHRAVLFDRLSVQFRLDGVIDQAASLSDRSIELAKAAGQLRLLGPFLENRAITESARSHFDAAIETQKAAIELYANGFPPVDRVQAYARLGQIYLNAGRHGAARRVLDVAIKEARTAGLRRSEAQCLCIRGDVEWSQGDSPRAETDWKDAASLLRGTHELRLKFITSTRLLRIASRSNDAASARAIRRRLSRWQPAIPASLPELQEFRQLVGSTDDVADGQLRH